jgi:hypothetical protein
MAGLVGAYQRAVNRRPAAHAVAQGGGREEAPAGVALIFECELGYTFGPAVWGQGSASEAVACVRDGLELGYVVSAILPAMSGRGGRTGRWRRRR